MIHSSKLHQLCLLTLAALIFATRVKAAGPSLLFLPSVINTQGDDEIVASVTINTAGIGVNGAGARIIYDPYYLTAVRIEPSEIFTDYPATTIDNSQGKITISGIASSPTDLFNGEGTFADIVFRPNRSGTSKVKFIFTPGDTTDSNIAVMTGNGDILSQVNELTVYSSEVTESSTTPSPSPTTSPILSAIKSQNSTFKRIASTLGLSKVADQYASAREGRSAITDSSADPLAPIVRQEPITDPSSTQPVASTSNVTKSSSGSIIFMLILLIIILIGIILWFVISHRQSTPTNPPIQNYPPIDPPVENL